MGTFGMSDRIISIAPFSENLFVRPIETLTLLHMSGTETHQARFYSLQDRSRIAGR